MSRHDPASPSWRRCKAIDLGDAYRFFFKQLRPSLGPDIPELCEKPRQKAKVMARVTSRLPDQNQGYRRRVATRILVGRKGCVRPDDVLAEHAWTMCGSGIVKVTGRFGVRMAAVPVTATSGSIGRICLSRTSLARNSSGDVRDCNEIPEFFSDNFGTANCLTRRCK